jgi:hypothetical protein
MKLVLLYFTIFSMCFGVFGVTSQKTSARPTRAYQSKDGSILKPTDAVYYEAMEFARLLNSKGIIVNSVHRSKLESLFVGGVEKAAFFRTEKGVLEVIFFPDPEGAEKVTVTEQREAGRYLYSFQGQPNPTPGDGFDSPRPMYFLMHRNWFVVLESEDLLNAVKSALRKS